MDCQQFTGYSSAETPSRPAVWEEGVKLPDRIGDRSLIEVWKSVAAQYPDRPAIAACARPDDRVRRWTYSELKQLVTRWAARLAHEGVTSGTYVGLCAVAEVEVPAGFLAILEAGGVVVPLDPSLPPARLRSMSAGCAIVLVSRSTAHTDTGVRQLNLSDDPGNHPPVTVAHDPDQPGVVYHTSGTTGRPKPVAIAHRALSSRILSMIDWFGITVNEVVCAGSTLAFDPFLQQLFFPLCTGGTLWLPDRAALLDPARFWAEATEQGLTHLNLVPSQIEPLLMRPPKGGLGSLKRVVAGAERMPKDLPARIIAALGEVAVYNMYGPTETTVDATGYRTKPAVTDQDIPIGTPLPGVRIRILDEQFRRVPVGEAGEVCIGGAGLAIGYVGMEEATAQAFIADPFGVPGDRLYRTGDRGRWLANGQLAFLGRRDDQVKIRGQRIELSEVEAALRAVRGVSAAVASIWNEAPGGPALIAHVTGNANLPQLRAELVGVLPPAAVPAHVLHVDRLPQLASGKIDRSALPRPVAGVVNVQNRPGSLEQAIASVWAGILGRPIDIEANLFETGAHSLHVPQALIGIEQTTGNTVSAVDLFRFPSVAALSRHLSGTAQDQLRPARHVVSSGEIAITGMAFRFPGASDCETFWADLTGAADRVRRLDAAALAESGAPSALVARTDFVPAHAAIDGADLFDPVLFAYSPGEAAGIEPQQRLLLELAWHALEDASCDPSIDGPVGVFAGVGFNAYLVDNLRDRLSFAGSPDRFSVVVGADKDFAATRIAYKLGLTGPAMTVNSACSTALSATATAIDTLRARRCRVALAGAASLGMFSSYGHVYAEGGIASRSGVCRPFDSEADGVVAGAGAAVLVLKRLEDAQTDGDRIYAVIRGVGVSNDGAEKAAFSAPSVSGQVAAISAALEDAGIAPAEVGFVEGHGTATQLGDPIEVAALNVAYRGPGAGAILLGSVKGNVGHLDAAAGMAGLIKAVLAVQHAVVPPTAHFSAPNSRIPFGEGPFRVNTTPEPWPTPAERPRLAGVNAFGMGGTNIHVIVAAPPLYPEVASSDRPVLITLSAATSTARDRLAASVADRLDGSVAGAAASLARRRAMRFRRAVVASSPAEAAVGLRGSKTLDAETTGRTVPVALLFPGQGAQQAGMARALYLAVPAFQRVVDEAASILRGTPVEDVVPLLIGNTGDVAATKALSETSRTQPALFITEFAIAKALEAYGIQPATLIGHSIGEYVAAALAGVMTFEDALRLVMERGRLMASASRGAMLAVSLSEADLLPIVTRCGADLAAVNGPKQCVASGTEEQIAELAESVKQLRGQTYRLPVSHAFHSALMEPVLERFAEAVAKTRLSSPTVPMVSNVSGGWLTPGEATDPGYWVRHLRGTVRFAAGLRLLAEDAARVLVEAGPGAALIRLARGAGVPEARAIATQPAEIPDGHSAFLLALGRLWVAGAPLDRRLAAGGGSQRSRLPGYPFERVRLWVEPGVEQKPEPTYTERPARASQAMQNKDVATVITDVWREVLGVTEFGSDDDFLSLGGDSLIAVRIAARLRERLGRAVTPGDLFSGGTVAGLARLIAAVGVVGDPATQELTHDGLAGRDQCRRLPSHLNVPPVGLCASEELVNNGPASCSQVSRVPPSVDPAGGLPASGELAHDAVAGRDQARRVSSSLGAAPAGRCASEKLAHNKLASSDQVRRVSPSVDTPPGKLCTSAQSRLAGCGQARQVSSSLNVAPIGLCVSEELMHNGPAGCSQVSRVSAWVDPAGGLRASGKLTDNRFTRDDQGPRVISSVDAAPNGPSASEELAHHAPVGRDGQVRRVSSSVDTGPVGPCAAKEVREEGWL